MRNRALTSLFCAFAAATGALAASPEGSRKVDTQELVRETQKESKLKDVLGLVWWVPTEFWEASAAKSSRVTPQGMSQISGIVGPYTIVAVVDADVGPFGSFKYHPAEETRRDFHLVGSNGALVSPIPEADLSGDLKNFLGMIQPILSNALGPMGQNIRFCVFPNLGKDKQPIVQASLPGSVEFNLRGESFKWRLPLAALVDPKTCPTDKEALPGNWIYCPIHGTKLQ